MARTTMQTPEPPERRVRKARTPEERQAQLINLAIDEAERQIRDGKATSQLLTHFLKLATVREEVEVERIRGDIELQKAKAEQIAGVQRTEELFKKAVDAFRGYQGQEEEFDEE